MIKRILVAVDGSPASLAAVQQAVHWAVLLQAQLQALFVADEQRFVYYPTAASFEGGVVMPVPLPEGRLQAEQAKVQAEEKDIRSALDKATQGKKLDVQYKHERGDVNAILVREARTADMVVIGKRGRFDAPGSKQAGPTTEALIHDAMRPVLVVPEGSRTQGPLLVAYDNSKGVQRILPSAVVLAEKSGQEVFILTVDDKPARAKELQEALIPFFQSHGLAVKLLVEKGKPAAAVVKAAEAQGAGMIVMGAFNRNPVYELFFGSTTLSVLERATCPILLTA
jgi:nucleotide-binding universal stress UspA family protein